MDTEITYTVNEQGDLYAHKTGDIHGYAYRYLGGSWKAWGLWSRICGQMTADVPASTVTAPLTDQDRRIIDRTH